MNYRSKVVNLSWRVSWTLVKTLVQLLSTSVPSCFLIFTAAIGVRIPVVAVKFHNVYDYTIVGTLGKCLKP